jgi:hypothetical protein
MLSDFHKALVFRYPRLAKDDGSLIERGTFVAPGDVLAVIDPIWKQISVPVWRVRLLAAGHGKYPIETWHMGGP